MHIDIPAKDWAGRLIEQERISDSALGNWIHSGLPMDVGSKMEYHKVSRREGTICL